MPKIKTQTKPVMTYWTPEFIAKLDTLVEKLSMRRNDFIKEAVREKYEREARKLKSAE